MNKILLIFRHELMHTLRRVGFIILTLAVPVLALLGIGIFRIVSGITAPPAEVTKIGYVDEPGIFSQFNTQGNLEFVNFNTPDPVDAIFGVLGLLLIYFVVIKYSVHIKSGATKNK